MPLLEFVIEIRLANEVSLDCPMCERFFFYVFDWQNLLLLKLLQVFPLLLFMINQLIKYR